MQKSALKPIPASISTWNSGREVQYECARCHAGLRPFGHKQRFCHICGAPIDWVGMPKCISAEDAREYHGKDVRGQQIWLRERFTKQE